MKIVILDAATLGKDERLKELERFGQVEIYHKSSYDQTVERCKGASIVLTNKVLFDRPTLEQLPELKLICITATGMNNVDLKSASEMGISVKNVSGYSTKSVAQCTFSMLLHLMSKVSQYDAYVKSGEYSNSPLFTNLMGGFEELSGKVWGIIGMGNIGREVAKIASAFGAEVKYASVSNIERKEEYVKVSLEELLRSSDIISIHSPLTDKTLNLITRDQFAIMKNSAILINVARGGIVNESDLIEAINQGQIASAGVDVFSVEPMASNSAFYQIKDKEKLVLTPHIAWASSQARELLIDKLIYNIEEFLGNAKTT